MDRTGIRILSQLAGRYTLYFEERAETAFARARGLFRKDHQKPLPGDWVAVQESGDPDTPYHITEILERRNCLLRPPTANVDAFLILASCSEPRPDFYLIDRLIAFAYARGLKAYLGLTKTDLQTPYREDLLLNYRAAVTDLFQLGEGEDEAEIERLTEAVQGQVTVLVGQSGVGKSSLMNRILGRVEMETGALSEKVGRGRQTTRQVILWPFQGCYLADSPGFQNFDPLTLGLTGEELIKGYPELSPLEDRCFFADCRHLGERGCAIETVSISAARLERYRDMRERLDSARRY